MTIREINFDGLIGPTHNYAALSFGNLASASNAGAVSCAFAAGDPPPTASLDSLAVPALVGVCVCSGSLLPGLSLTPVRVQNMGVMSRP